MDPKRSLEHQLRGAVYGGQVIKGPNEGSVFDFGKLGDPLVRGIFGEIIIIDDYAGFRRPRVGQKVTFEYVRYGRSGTYSFGRLIDVERQSPLEKIAGLAYDLYHTALGRFRKG